MRHPMTQLLHISAVSRVTSCRGNETHPSRSAYLKSQFHLGFEQDKQQCELVFIVSTQSSRSRRVRLHDCQWFRCAHDCLSSTCSLCACLERWFVAFVYLSLLRVDAPMALLVDNARLRRSWLLFLVVANEATHNNTKRKSSRRRCLHTETMNLC
jgi:hypothetical protein